MKKKGGAGHLVLVYLYERMDEYIYDNIKGLIQDVKGRKKLKKTRGRCRINCKNCSKRIRSKSGFCKDCQEYKKGKVLDIPTHGLWGYHQGCRCLKCRGTKKQYNKKCEERRRNK